MMAVPRKAHVNITYTKKVKAGAAKNKKRTATVMREYLEGFTYTDPATGESDTISLQVLNIDLRWANKWIPKKKDTMVAKIVTNSWTKSGKKKTFNCGKFCVDDLSFSGPTLSCTIGGVSTPEGNAFRSTERSKTWKDITLKELARNIASKYHMKLIYTGPVIKIGTLEQSTETDCSFLNKICSDYAMAIKVYSGKVVIFDKGVYEARKAVATINKANILDWSYNSTLTGTYTGATIKYTAGDDDKELECKVGSGKRILSINEKVDNLADAQLKACGKVNTENEKAVTMSISIMANTRIAAGSTVKITGLYKLNGKYFVDKVTHKIEAESAYTMDLELHKCQKRIKPAAAAAAPAASAAASTALAVGDRVTVNGPAYYGGNGGRANQCKGMTMYITQILGGSYKYKYGVAKRKGGTRYGWCEESSLTKA